MSLFRKFWFEEVAATILTGVDNNLNILMFRNVIILESEILINVLQWLKLNILLIFKIVNDS